MAVYYQAPCEVGRRKEFLASDFRGAFLLRQFPHTAMRVPFRLARERSTMDLLSWQAAVAAYP